MLKSNKKITAILLDIAEESAKLRVNNQDDKEHLTRMIAIYNETLSDEERVVVLREILDCLMYKKALEHPDRIATVYEAKTKYVTTILLWLLGVGIVATAVLGLSPVVNNVINIFGKIASLM